MATNDGFVTQLRAQGAGKSSGAPGPRHHNHRRPARNHELEYERGISPAGATTLPIAGGGDPSRPVSSYSLHHARDPIDMQGGPTFHFVTAGFDAVRAQALEAAAGNGVDIAGGASAVRQALTDSCDDAGLLSPARGLSTAWLPATWGEARLGNHRRRNRDRRFEPAHRCRTALELAAAADTESNMPDGGSDWLPVLRTPTPPPSRHSPQR